MLLTLGSFSVIFIYYFSKYKQIHFLLNPIQFSSDSIYFLFVSGSFSLGLDPVSLWIRSSFSLYQVVTKRNETRRETELETKEKMNLLLIRSFTIGLDLVAP